MTKHQHEWGTIIFQHWIHCWCSTALFPTLARSKLIDITQYRARYVQTYLQHSTNVLGAQYTQSNQTSTQYDSKNKKQHVHNRCSTTSRAHKQSQELSHQEGSRELQPLTHIASHYSVNRPVGRPQRIPHRCTPLRGTGLPAESFVVDFCLVVQLRVL